jgi:FKBP-type peptidyl-prolyl cis-trans isomerase FkpA
MSLNSEMPSNCMKLQYVLLVLLVSTIVSCDNHPENTSSVSLPGNNEMADLNRYLVRKDRERIQNFIERKHLNMKETQTGLWYQIIKEGEGPFLNEKDQIVIEYECSLLDGTKCYSSKDTGPRELMLGKSEMEAGLNEGLRLLKTGSEAIFIIPPFLAYGLIGDRKLIPPRSVIVYSLTTKKK